MKNITNLEEKENPLFKRREIKFTINSEVAPSYADIRKIISKKVSTSEENIRIKKILGTFGSNNFTVSANIYESEQDKLNIEGKSKKDKVAEPEVAQEAPTESAPEPVPESQPEPTPEQPEQTTEIPTKESKPEEKKE